MVWFYTLRLLPLPTPALELVQDALAGGPRSKDIRYRGILPPPHETGSGPPPHAVPVSVQILSWHAPDTLDLDIPPWPVELAARPRHFSE